MWCKKIFGREKRPKYACGNQTGLGLPDKHKTPRNRIIELILKIGS